MKYALKYIPEDAICDVEDGVCYGTFSTIESAQVCIDNLPHPQIASDFAIVPLPDHLAAYTPVAGDDGDDGVSDAEYFADYNYYCNPD